MNDHETQQFENELRRLKPARTPELFADRLQALVEKAVEAPVTPKPVRAPFRSMWLKTLRWLLPTATAAAAILLVARFNPEFNGSRKAAENFRADDVQMSQDLVATFDVVGQMPTGEPVRFRVREWSDATTLSDSARGVVVEQRTPRLEVTPVRFETY